MDTRVSTVRSAIGDITIAIKFLNIKNYTREHLQFPKMQEDKMAAAACTCKSESSVKRQTVGITNGNNIPIVPNAFN